MIYRNWEKDDNEKISQLEIKCFNSPWSLQMIEDTYSTNNFVGYVCEEDGEIIGYIGLIFDNWDGSILNIAVDSEYRKNGIGTKLMELAIEFLKGRDIENLYLEVAKSNLNAQSLYTKLGFQAVGIRKKYYNYTEDAIVMAKSLKG